MNELPFDEIMKADYCGQWAAWPRVINGFIHYIPYAPAWRALDAIPAGPK